MPYPLERPEDGDWEKVRRNTAATAQRLNPAMPNARVFNSGNISVNNSTITALTFDSERWDEGDLHSTSANTSRLTAPITGLYLIGGNVEWAANATGLRELDIRVNGTTFTETDNRVNVGAGRATFISVSTLYRLAGPVGATPADYVELIAFQTSGGALNVTATGNYSPEFWMVRLGGYVNMGVS